MNTTFEPQLHAGRDSGYLTLRERAVEILAAAPAGHDASTLARTLFGAGSGERWVLLLPTVLADDDRLECLDGQWRLKSRARTGDRPIAVTPASTLPPVIVPDPRQPDDVIHALALATTGADPRRHRVARIAVVRFEHGEVAARLDCVVSSGRRLSRLLSDAAQIAVDDLDGAPTFADVAPDLRAFLDRHVVHVYGARRAKAFLDAEARRAEVPGFDVELLELDSLVGSLLPAMNKPGLFAAADELGVPHSGRGSPLADAELTARVLARVRDRLAASPSRLTVNLPPAKPDASKPLPFTREWLSTVPETSGVYIFEDHAGRALYVGKAVSLRQRLSSYVRRQPSLDRRLEGLAVRTCSVRTIAAPSDLEATLLEARLLRELTPTFNVAREVRPPTTIVRAAPDAKSPGVRLVAHIASDGARYFGPFESVSTARQTLAVARAAYPEAFARRRGDVARQRDAVLQVCQLLAGQKQPTLANLRASMQTAASAGDRPEVDRLRAALRDVQALTIRPSDLTGLADGWRLLVLEPIVPGSGRLHLVHDGALVASTFTDTSALPADPVHLQRFADEMFGDAADESEIARPNSWSVSDSTILMRWLAQTRSRLEVQRLPPDGLLDLTRPRS